MHGFARSVLAIVDTRQYRRHIELNEITPATVGFASEFREGIVHFGFMARSFPPIMFSP